MRFRHRIPGGNALGGSVPLPPVCGGRAVPDGKCRGRHHPAGDCRGISRLQCVFQGKMQKVLCAFLLQRRLYGKFLQIPSYHPWHLWCELRDGTQESGMRHYDQGRAGRSRRECIRESNTERKKSHEKK